MAQDVSIVAVQLAALWEQAVLWQGVGAGVGLATCVGYCGCVACVVCGGCGVGGVVVCCVVVLGWRVVVWLDWIG